jgi:hypothetical protein
MRPYNPENRTTRLATPSVQGGQAAAEVQARPLCAPESPAAAISMAREFGGRQGAEPTRFGDWEKNGRCIDF